MWGLDMSIMGTTIAYRIHISQKVDLNESSTLFLPALHNQSILLAPQSSRISLPRDLPNLQPPIESSVLEPPSTNPHMLVLSSSLSPYT